MTLEQIAAEIQLVLVKQSWNEGIDTIAEALRTAIDEAAKPENAAQPGAPDIGIVAERVLNAVRARQAALGEGGGE